ncbi:MAG: response regulator [Desulfobulbaceae bacterium]|nr:response regulator [Desulfobulbaceae bacterium]
MSLRIAMEHAGIGQKGEYGLGMSPLKVLVVDDDEMVANFMRQVISRLDHLAEIAGGCEEALQKISEADFDLAFVDVNLSDGDGIELINEIRKTFPDISIVAMTGNSSREMEIRVREQRVICFLIKPFEMKEVCYIVGHVLKRKSQALTRGNTISRGY